MEITTRESLIKQLNARTELTLEGDTIKTKEGGARPGAGLAGANPTVAARNDFLTLAVSHLLHVSSLPGSDHFRKAMMSFTKPADLPVHLLGEAVASAKVDIVAHLALASGNITNEELSEFLGSKAALALKADLADVPLHELASHVGRILGSTPAARAAAEAAEKSHATAKGMTDALEAFVGTLGDGYGDRDLEDTLKFDFDKLLGAVEQGVKDGTLLEADARAVEAAALGALNKVADKLRIPEEKRPEGLKDLKAFVQLNQRCQVSNRALAARLDGILSSGGRKALNLSGGDTLSAGDLDKLLNAAAKGNGACKKAEFAIVRTKWLEAQVAGETDFAKFHETLPDRYRKIANLESLLDAGVSNKKMLRTLEKTVDMAAKGFGSNKDLLAICERLATSPDKWAADTLLTRLTREVMGGHSFTGHQALEGAARGLKAKIQTKMEESDFAGSVKDAILRVFGKKTDATKASTQVQMERAAARAAVATEVAEKTGARHVENASVREGLADLTDPGLLEPLRKIYGDDAVGLLLKGQKPEKEIKGAQFSTGVLAVKVTLDDASLTREQKQARLTKIKFQDHLNFEKMRGSAKGAINGVQSDEAGNQFKDLFETLKHETDGKAWNDAAAKMSYLLRLTEAEKKAVAVLASKDFGKHMDSALESLEHEFKSVFRSKNDPAVAALRKKLTDSFVSIVGSTRRAGEAARLTRKDDKAATAAEAAARKEIGRELSSHVKDTFNEAITIAICSTFGDSEEMSLEDLLKGRPAETKDYGNWKFFNDTLACLDKLGFGGDDIAGLAKELLTKRFQDLKPNSLTKLEENTKPSLEHRFLEFMHVNRYLDFSEGGKEIRSMMRLGCFERATDDLLDQVAGGKNLALSQEKGAELKMKVFSTGDIDVNVKAHAEHKDAVRVWQEGGAFHVRLQRSTGGGLGASVEGILDCITVEAEVNGAVLNGCVLDFSSKEDCKNFLAPLLAGVKAPGSLALCSEIRTVRGGEFGASAKVSIGSDGLVSALGLESEDGEGLVDFLGVNVEAGVDGSVGETVTGNDNEVTREWTVKGEATVSVSVQLATGDLVEGLGEALGDKADAVLKYNERKVEKGCRYEERRRVTTGPGGRPVLSAERTRVFILESKAEARAILEGMKVPEDKIQDVLNAIPDDGEFRMEVDRSLTEKSRGEIRMNGWKNFRSAEFEVTSVRIETEDQSVEKNNKYAIGKILTFHKAAAGAMTQTEIIKIKDAA